MIKVCKDDNKDEPYYVIFELFGREQYHGWNRFKTHDDAVIYADGFRNGLACAHGVLLYPDIVDHDYSKAGEDS